VIAYKIFLGAGEEAVSYSASNKALSQLAHKYGLEEYVTKNPSQHGKVSDYTLATTVEALLGAVWIDCNKDFEVVERVSSNINMVKK
jgi:ribonuclease-3